MVTILPAPPLIHESNHLMLQIALLYAGFLVLALIFANVLAHSITGRLTSSAMDRQLPWKVHRHMMRSVI